MRWFIQVLLIVLACLLLPSANGKKTSGGKSWFGGKSSSKAPKQPTPMGGYNYGKMTGYKKPSSGFGKAKNILAGLAAGYVGYKLTKGAAGLFYNGMNYYPGHNYYPGLSSPSKIRCEYKLSNDESNALNLTLENATRATTLIYECDARTQRCCEMQCCPIEGYNDHSGSSSWVRIVFGLLVSLLFVACIGTLVFKFSRRLLDCVMPGRQGADQFQPVNTGCPLQPDQPPPAQGPYASQPGYPSSYGYPAYNPQPGYQGQPGFAPQPNYPPAQGGYPAYPPDHPPQPTYQPQPTYPPDQAPQPAYQPQPAYPPAHAGYPSYPSDPPPPYGFKP